MRLFLYLVVSSLLMNVISCKSQHSNKHQGLTGTVVWVEGNQMPPASTVGKPVQRTILIYEPTSLDDTEGQAPLFTKVNSNLIAKVVSNGSGKFKIGLPAGKYSVFVEEKDKYYANSFDSQNYIQLIDIQDNKWSEINISINYSASF